MISRPDRSGLRAAVLLWATALVGVYLGGLAVDDQNTRYWLGQWLCIIWACVGWLPILLFLRSEPQPPEDRQ